MYVRRPKVKFIGAKEIHVKFNQLIFNRSEYLTSQGIPVLAGVPLADSLEFIKDDTPSIWFSLSRNGTEECCTINTEDKTSSPLHSARILDAESIFEIIERDTRLTSWAETLEKIKEMRRMLFGNYMRWPLFSGDLYKPIYFIIHMD